MAGGAVPHMPSVNSEETMFWLSLLLNGSVKPLMDLDLHFLPGSSYFCEYLATLEDDVL